MHLLHLPLLSLGFLDVGFGNPDVFQNSLELFSKFSRNIRRISIRIHQFPGRFRKIGPSYICYWQNLRSVKCPQVSLDLDTLVHLSRMSALTRPTFALSATFPACNPPLFFSNLRRLTLHSKSLDPISQLISHTPSAVDKQDDDKLIHKVRALTSRRIRANTF